VLGGTGADTIDSGAGNDLVFGDHAVLEAVAGHAVDPAALPVVDGRPFTFTSAHTSTSDAGGNDTIRAGAGRRHRAGRAG
jgi:Ca2+-binding RTX toxin-like protein